MDNGIRLELTKSLKIFKSWANCWPDMVVIQWLSHDVLPSDILTCVKVSLGNNNLSVMQRVFVTQTHKFFSQYTTLA